MPNNEKLRTARAGKQDEFYTTMPEIEAELAHYRPYFKDKVIYCNCDDPARSNFWRYFVLHFAELGLKKLMATHYQADKPTYLLTLSPDSKLAVKRPLTQNGDFRSQECLALLKEADMVVTNPPFSLFHDFMAQLTAANKQFLVLGNTNGITYKEVFPLLKANRLWLGYRTDAMLFQVPDNYPMTSKLARMDDYGHKLLRVPSCTWYTNLPVTKRSQPLFLHKLYTPDAYPAYDNYQAINVNKTVDIPKDYMGVMGVPVTFMAKHSPEQFEILGATESEGTGAADGLWTQEPKQGVVNGKKVYKRIFIRRKTENKD